MITARLISLEGRFDLLPESPGVQEDIGRALVSDRAELSSMVARARPGRWCTDQLSLLSASALEADVVANLDPSVLNAVSHVQT